MTEYEKFERNYGYAPEDRLEKLKKERASLQKKIDNTLIELAKLTEIKQDKHYEINHLKRIIGEAAIH